MRKILPYALIGVVSLAIAGLLRQRRRPIPTPPPLTFLFENPLVEAFAGSEPLVERLGLAPGMRVLDAGCGPGRLTIPVARAVGATGEVVALDSQRAMLEKLEHRLEAESTINVRTLEAGLGEGVLEREAFDRVLLAFVLGEVRDREAAARELYAALKPGGILSVTEIFGDPDYRRPASVRRVVEPAGFELVERFGGFPVYTLNFRRPGVPAAQGSRRRDRSGPLL
jgi:2-polyprenyl-3-methyl-5-hydroxy-6-metoxy-1,4-benzoquinol methylase